MIWTHFQNTDSTFTTSSGEKIELHKEGRAEPEILELFAAVEANDLKTIYQYAAPELKEKVSFDVFTRIQLPDRVISDISIISTKSVSAADKHILLILKFKENEVINYCSMRWEKNPDSIHYDTYPFKMGLIYEFDSFPAHIIN